MAASSDNYIPRPDGDFTAWVNAYLDALKIWWGDHGYDKHDLDGLGAAVDRWNTSWAALVGVQALAASAAADKKEARRALEPLARRFAKLVQTDVKATNADRAALGLSVPGSSAGTGFTPTTRPLVRIASGQRLQHQLRFADEATPTRRAKPRGALGAEVWLALVGPHDPPPPLGTAYRYLALVSDGASRAGFTSADAGRQACYAARWRSPRGEVGPWSEVMCATVAA